MRRDTARTCAEAKRPRRVFVWSLCLSCAVAEQRDRRRDAARQGARLRRQPHIDHASRGLRAALAAIEDPTKPDRGQFLLELIRRSHRTPIGASDPHDPLVKALVAHLDAAVRSTTSTADRPEVLPLPLPPSIWIEHVFARSVTPETLTRAIVGSRSASLLYFGLFALDDRTRAWLAEQPALVGELAADTLAARSCWPLPGCAWPTAPCRFPAARRPSPRGKRSSVGV